MKIIDDYLEVTEPEIAVLFLGKAVEFPIMNRGWQTDGTLDGVEKSEFWIRFFNDSGTAVEIIRIPKETVKKVCEAEEGKACFRIRYKKVEVCSFDYYITYQSSWMQTNRIFLEVNAITIGKTVSELRKLVEWMEIK